MFDISSHELLDFCGKKEIRKFKMKLFLLIEPENYHLGGIRI